MHRQHNDYTSLGASGAITGIVFASIALFPGMRVGLFGIPIFIPAWAYGLLFVLFSIYGIQSRKDNIGHDAHLGGGLAGLLIALAMMPAAIFRNYLSILLIIVPSAIFIYLIVTRPHLLLLKQVFGRRNGQVTLEDRYNTARQSREEELNKLLDKISKNGLGSLSSKEQDRLRELGK